MRFADGPTVQVEVIVAAAPERVWELVTDVARMGDWSPEYKGGEWIEGATGPVAGARFRGKNNREGREWETVSVVTVADPSRSFAFAVGDPENASATWRFDLTPEGGGTRVRQHVLIGPGPSGLTWAIGRAPDREEEFVDGRIEEHRSNMQATLEGLKKAAES